jgi:chloramphenicol-sensitive protein RarD
MSGLTKEFLGWLFGFFAFVLWGIAPIYFQFLKDVKAEEILAHRIVWCIPTTILLMFFLKKPIDIMPIIRQPHLILLLTISTLLITVNWLIFTWAVTHQHILATSLGYFINPILSILMGVFLLKESLNKWQWLAVLLLFLAIANSIFQYGEFPWIALSLAVTFALYGFIKKKMSIDALNGFLIETLLVLPFALIYVVWSYPNNESVFFKQIGTLGIFFIGLGLVTTIPLVLFSTAAQRIPLSGLGFLQFIGPSLNFIIAIFIYNESLNNNDRITFILIWISIALYLIESIKKKWRS